MPCVLPICILEWILCLPLFFCLNLTSKCKIHVLRGIFSKINNKDNLPECWKEFCILKIKFIYKTFTITIVLANPKGSSDHPRSRSAF